MTRRINPTETEHIHRWAEAERGLAIDWRAFTGCALVALIAGLALLAGGGGTGAVVAAKATPDPWPGWEVVAVVLLVLAGLLVVMVLTYIGVRLWQRVQLYQAEVDAARLAARRVEQSDRGQFPGLLSRDRDAMVDPNAAPGGRVEGLNGRPAMPDPETDDQRQATMRAAAIRLAIGATSGGLTQTAAKLLAGLARDDGPPLPEVRVLEDGSHIERLLDDGSDDG